ncbi:unnamed protein product [Closterium sp. Naga37s-1]|nr:unnamed protein product [Closterium sp. Naga37s-1]
MTALRVNRGLAPSWHSQLSASVLSAPALLRILSRAPSITSVSLAECALDFYDDAFLTSLISASSRLVRLSLHEARFTAEPQFGIGHQPLDEFFRLAAPRLQELALSHCLGQMMKLPDSIASLSSLRVLRLHSKFLRMLPDGICQLSTLQELCLSCPLLLRLPEAIGRLESLTQLSLSECKGMRHLSESFGDLSSLTSLQIDGSWQVIGFPVRIGALQRMRRLELRNFDNGLPDACKRWTNLEEVTLDSCRNIPYLPAARIESLTALTIRNCRDFNIPRFELIFASHLRHVTIDWASSGVSLESLSHLTSLERLEVAHVQENEPFPVGLFALPSLAFVKLGCVKWMDGGNVVPLWESYRASNIYLTYTSPTVIYNATLPIAAAATIATFPPLGRSLRHLDLSMGEHQRSERRFMSPGICALEWLTHLTISDLHISNLLPIALGRMCSLRSLSLSGRFQFFPPSLALLASSLQSLTLHFTREGGYLNRDDQSCPGFSTLPDGFGSLQQLTQLEISKCASFTHLPSSFPSLPSLQVACFNLCKALHSLPPLMGQMLRLEVLQLWECVALKSLPRSLREARALRHVDVYGSGLLEEGGEMGVFGKGVCVVRGGNGKPERVGP